MRRSKSSPPASCRRIWCATPDSAKALPSSPRWASASNPWQYHPAITGRDRPRPRLPRHHDHPQSCRRGAGRRALSGRRQEILAGWKKDVAELAKCPNVSVKLGGVGMTSFGFDFHERDVPPSSENLAAAWRQYIEPCIEAFGPDRCMFESNFPPGQAIGRVHRAVECLQAHLLGGVGGRKTGPLQRHRSTGVPLDGTLIRLPRPPAIAERAESGGLQRLLWHRSSTV